MLISTMLLIGLPEVAQAAPNPNDCNPANQNVEVTEFPSGIKYRCVCLTSVTTGKTYCQWKAEGPKASSDLQIGAEWGTSGQLNYGETANTDDGFLRSFGQTSNFNNGLLSNVGSGSLADALTVFNWTGSAWNKCLDSGFYYNGPPAAAFNLTWNFNSPPCGDGYYATNNYGFVWDGARWQGNPSGIWSGYKLWQGCPLCRVAQPAAPTAPPPAATRAPDQTPGGAQPAQPRRAGLVSGVRKAS